jgi:peptidoglycan/LPS O-acetylase OafA/YrhL
MLGFYRYILALMVVSSHLWVDFMWWKSAYAVFCFYLLSGYLMTLVINEVYNNQRGPLRYFTNRLLRIYPIYWAVLAISIVCSTSYPQFRSQPIGAYLNFGHVMPLPETPLEWLGNLTLLYPFDAKLSISPAWSLRIELIYYAALLLLARNRWVVITWFAFSLLYILHLEYSGAQFIERYTSVLGSSIAFSLGALVYYLRRITRLPAWHVPLAALLYLIHLCYAPEIWGFSRSGSGFSGLFNVGHYGLYGAIVLGAYLLFAIVCNDKKQHGWYNFGHQLGNLAYPIFLIHWSIAILCLALGISFEQKSYFIPVSFVLLNTSAILLYWVVEKPINVGLRNKIRERKF